MGLQELLQSTERRNTRRAIERPGIDEAARHIVDLGRTGRVAVLSGAGTSTESGIPDYRGKNGVSTSIGADKLHVDYFRHNPQLAWQVYLQIYGWGQYAKPNAAHKAIHDLEMMGYLSGIITQNVDDLHQRAGSEVVAYHKCGDHLVCPDCHWRRPAPDFSDPATEVPPHCRNCGTIERPDVILYGEHIPRYLDTRVNDILAVSDLCLVVGSSLQAGPANTIYDRIFDNGALAAWFNFYSPIVADNGSAARHMIEIAAPRAITPPDFVVLGNVADTLPALVNKIRQYESPNQAEPT